MPEKPFCPGKYYKQLPAVLNRLQNLEKKNRFFFFLVDKARSFYLAEKARGRKASGSVGHKVFTVMHLMIMQGQLTNDMSWGRHC